MTTIFRLMACFNTIWEWLLFGATLLNASMHNAVTKTLDKMTLAKYAAEKEHPVFYMLYILVK